MQKLENIKNLAKGISVLYVEDNDVAREKTTKLLKRIFTNVDVATSGKEGLLLYLEKKQDLIISDIIMNNLNGLEMTKAIKDVSKEQRVIFLSAYTEQRYLSQAIELGADGFVFKPIDTDKFYFILEKTLKQIKSTKENIQYKQNLEKLVEERSADLTIKNYELTQMIEEVKKVNSLKEEMQIAKKVQKNFLPKEMPQNENIEIATFFEAAQYVGGDYYDLFACEDGTLSIIIADVSGHGIVPAITMSTFRGACRTIFALDMDFEKQVSTVNNLMCEDSKTNDFFITAFFIKYNEKDKKIEYISTGHNDILFYSTKKDKIEQLKSTAIPLGIFTDVKYEVITKEINKNDFLVLYTDGLTEAANKEKEMFGLDSLMKIVQKSKKLDASEVLINIQTSLNDFVLDQPITDDTTILVTKFL
ncbi:MAG: SpoIIE family protein phosphatase [Poseidonibacter sp.]|uniref:SpoIIE family protein phosphatase n=1 Tax=Poseidonibacter sp. TaxID=2321188 RepID=UPI00359DBAD8